MGGATREVTSPVPLRTLYRRAYARHRPESECDVDIYTIIFLALAVFIFLRLRNVLGQRTGSERPPYDRAARDVVHGAQDNNVVPMPGAVIDQAPLAPTADVVPPTDRWKGIAEPGTPLALGLDAIAAQDSSFDPRHFLSGARSAYEMIVLAFANGDRRAWGDPGRFVVFAVRRGRRPRASAISPPGLAARNHRHSICPRRVGRYRRLERRRPPAGVQGLPRQLQADSGAAPASHRTEG